MAGGFIRINYLVVGVDWTSRIGPMDGMFFLGKLPGTLR